ncbi:hypothetical protein ANO14919_067900 [Xylariales sp. No.14919]|nr:hypothetical protein ANO14919_067900 [Xylariales sp. No.14919]
MTLLCSQLTGSFKAENDVEPVNRKAGWIGWMGMAVLLDLKYTIMIIP